MTALEILLTIALAVIAANVAIVCRLLYVYRAENPKRPHVHEISPDAGGLL